MRILFVLLITAICFAQDDRHYFLQPNENTECILMGSEYNVDFSINDFPIDGQYIGHPDYGKSFLELEGFDDSDYASIPIVPTNGIWNVPNHVVIFKDTTVASKVGDSICFYEHVIYNRYICLVITRITSDSVCYKVRFNGYDLKVCYEKDSTIYTNSKLPRKYDIPDGARARIYERHWSGTKFYSSWFILAKERCSNTQTIIPVVSDMNRLKCDSRQYNLMGQVVPNFYRKNDIKKVLLISK
jgi:hypothetical protein